MSAQPKTNEPTFPLSVFHDRYGSTVTNSCISMSQVAALVQKPSALEKGKLPLLKFAIFGDVKSADGSLRHDLNVLEITGVELDYDGEEMAFGVAAAKLRKAKIECVLYTSPSYADEAPRWRVVARLSTPIKPPRKMTPAKRADFLRTARAKQVRRIDAALGFVAANESRTLSQSFYFGQVRGGHSVDVIEIAGRCIDKCAELDKIKPPKPPEPPKKKIDGPTITGMRPYPEAMTDDQILERYVYPSANGARLKKLLSGDTSDYDSNSEADLAAASDLAFWFYLDAAKIEDVMRDSALFRDKWDEHKTYLARTIKRALAGKSEYFGQSTERVDTSGDESDEPTPKGEAKTKGKKKPPEDSPKKGFDYAQHMRPAQELIDNPPPPIQFLVQDLLACGASILLVGKPKSYKSTLAMQIGLALCGNKAFIADWALFGKITKSYRVAIIDYEQSEEIAAQMIARFGAEKATGLIRINEFPKLDIEGLKELRRLIKEQKLNAVIIDSWTRAAPTPTRNLGVFQNEGDAMQAVTKVAHDTGCLIMTIAHGGKREAADDPLQMIAGTNALPASVDDVIVLFKDGDDEGHTVRRKLFVSGRNIAKHGTYVLEKNGAEPCFKLIGSEESVVKGELRRSIVQLLGVGREMTPSEIGTTLGKDRSLIHRTLMGLVGDKLISPLGNGKYGRRTTAISAAVNRAKGAQP